MAERRTLAVTALAVAYLAAGLPSHDALLAVVPVLTFACGRFVVPWRSAVAAGALLVALVARGEEIVPYLLVVIAPRAAGVAVRSRQELVERVARRAREVEAQRDELARLSVQRERLRIARELHDIVAHHLAVVVVQAGAGRLAPEDPGERFALIRQAGTQALADMDRLVDLLQPGDAQHGWRAVAPLLEQARAAGVRVDHGGVPAAVGLTAGGEQAAYAVVREGLTNAMKHAPGSTVSVRVAIAGDGLQIEVRDSGAVAQGALAGAGGRNGLQGLRERLEAVGGRLDAGPVDGGWRLRALIPEDESKFAP